MPVVLRAERDMFRLSSIIDVAVNPVNTVGAAGKGLALEFRNRHPEAYQRYLKACQDGKLVVGKIQVIKDPSVRYSIVSLPTKRHFADGSDPDDIRRGLDQLRRWLQLPEHSLYTVAMPMLGCGEGRLGYEVMEPAFYEYLDDLDNVVMLCQLPERMSHIPKYLTIIGPRVFGVKYDAQGNERPQYRDEYAYIENGVNEALKAWSMQWSDYDAIVSGGAIGVDTVACGSDRLDPSYQESLSAKYLQAPPIICKADWKRLGNAAGFIRNNTVVDIATDLIAIRPPNTASVGTTAAVKLAYKANEHARANGLPEKRIHIVGNADLSASNQSYVKL